MILLGNEVLEDVINAVKIPCTAFVWVPHLRTGVLPKRGGTIDPQGRGSVKAEAGMEGGGSRKPGNALDWPQQQNRSERDSSPESAESAWLCQYPDFGFLASRL